MQLDTDTEGADAEGSDVGDANNGKRFEREGGDRTRCKGEAEWREGKLSTVTQGHVTGHNRSQIKLRFPRKPRKSILRQ